MTQRYKTLNVLTYIKELSTSKLRSESQLSPWLGAVTFLEPWPVLNVFLINFLLCSSRRVMRLIVKVGLDHVL
jgi:hypothetical protein